MSDRQSTIAKKRQNTDSTFKVSLFQSLGFGVQAKSEEPVPATKAELWNSYQQAKHLNLKGANPAPAPILPIQAKLTVGKPGDKYEQEADSMAAQVMAMPESGQVQREELSEEEEEVQMKPLGATISPLVQREALPEEEEEVQMKPLGATISPLVQREALPEEEELQMKPCDNGIQRELAPEEEEEPELQMKPLGNLVQREPLPEVEEIQTKQLPASNSQVPTSSLESSLSSSKGGGNPLPGNVRSFMEPRFGADFSDVRVHTDSAAVQMNQAVNAQAFAHGQDIYFGAGKSPGNNDLTAHELTHVVQQTGSLQAKLITHQYSGQFADNFQTIQRDTSTPGTQTSSPRPATNWNSFISRLDLMTQVERQTALQGIRARGQWEEMLNSLGNRHVATIQSWLNQDVGDGQTASLGDRLRVGHNSDRAQRALASIDTAAGRDRSGRITPRLRELLALGVALPRLDVEKPAPTGNPIGDLLSRLITEVRSQDSVTQEGVLTIAQVNQAVNALIWMPRREYLRLSLLLELSGDRARLTQSFLLLEATAARAESFNPAQAHHHPGNLRALEGFSNSIREMDQQTAIDQTSATSTSSAHSEGLTQKFTDSCGPTAAQLIRAEADPVEALRMNEHNELGQDALSNPTAREQESVLERHDHQTARARGQSTIISAITAALPGSNCTATQRQAVLDYINGRHFSHPHFAIGITKLEQSMGSSFPGATALRMVREGNRGSQVGLLPEVLVREANNQMDVDARTGRRWQDLFDNQLWGLFVAANKQVNAVNMAAWSGRVTALLNQSAPLVENGTDVTFIVYWHNGGGHFMTFTDVRTFGGQRKFLVHDPWTGTTTWMFQSTILSGGPWPPGNQGLICGLQG